MPSRTCRSNNKPRQSWRSNATPLLAACNSAGGIASPPLPPTPPPAPPTAPPAPRAHRVLPELRDELEAQVQLVGSGHEGDGGGLRAARLELAEGGGGVVAAWRDSGSAAHAAAAVGYSTPQPGHQLSGVVHLAFDLSSGSCQSPVPPSAMTTGNRRPRLPASVHSPQPHGPLTPCPWPVRSSSGR
jgi:hypothetical protein